MLTIASYLVNSEGLSYLADMAFNQSPESIVRVYSLFPLDRDYMLLNEEESKLTIHFKGGNYDVISGDSIKDLKFLMESL